MPKLIILAALAAAAASAAAAQPATPDRSGAEKLLPAARPDWPQFTGQLPNADHGAPDARRQRRARRCAGSPTGR